MEEKIKLLNPKLDVVFQALFGEEGSERITKAFLERILDIEIQEIELNQNPILRRDKIEGKQGVLDVIAKINNNQNVDIEMQMAKKANIKDRILYYWSRLYVRSIKKTENYEKLEKSVVILISDEKIKDLEDLECHTEWKIVEMKNRKKILTDKLEIHIIELEKLENDIDSVSTELLNWLSFLQNPESERVKMCMENNKEIKEAKEKLERISEDEKMQQLAWWSEKALLEENERKSEIRQIEYGRKELEDGKKELEDGKKELEDGKKELEDGKKELEDGKKEFAKRLKECGVSIEEIIKYTHLTKEEIEKL